MKWVEFSANLAQSITVTRGTDQHLQSDLERDGYKLILQMQEAWNAHHDSDRKLVSKKAISDNTLLELLKARRGLGASDPRDMIFAHTNIASDGGHEDMTIDYTKTCAHIYTRFARYILKEYGLNDLLNCVRDVESTHNPHYLPSWVPDWSNPGQHSRLPGDYSSRPWYVEASQGSLQLLWMRNLSIIAFQSRVTDRIISVSQELSVPQTPDTIGRRELNTVKWENFYVAQFRKVVF